KTIPEGGYYAAPARRSGDGVVILGDSAGFVDVPSLKGIHYAMQSGMLAARAIHAGLKTGDASAARLAEYDRLVNASFIMKDLHRTRNMRPYSASRAADASPVLSPAWIARAASIPD